MNIRYKSIKTETQRILICHFIPQETRRGCLPCEGLTVLGSFKKEDSHKTGGIVRNHYLALNVQRVGFEVQ